MSIYYETQIEVVHILWRPNVMLNLCSVIWLIKDNYNIDNKLMITEWIQLKCALL